MRMWNNFHRKYVVILCIDVVNFYWAYIEIKISKSYMYAVLNKAALGISTATADGKLFQSFITS